MAAKSSIRITGSTITIDGLQIQAYINQNKKQLATAARSSTTARNLVLRYFSDFIAKEGPFSGEPKEGFSNPKAGPDIAGSIQDFEKFFGFTPAGSDVYGSYEAYAELKQRTSTFRDVTITSGTLTGSTLSSFLSSNKLTETTKDTGEATYSGPKINKLSSAYLAKFIKSNPSLRNNIENQIKQKFENFVLIDYLDKTKKGVPRVKALGNAAKVLLGSMDILSSKNLSISARQVRSSSNKLSIVFQYELSPVGYNLFLKKATDITTKFHRSLASDVSSRFMSEAITRFVKSSSKQSTFNFLSSLYGIAKEFEADKGIVYSSEIQQPKQGIITTTYNMQQKQQKKSTQHFISGVQLTALVQKRLKSTMGKGAPNPPDFKERTTRFRKSVTAYPNYRKNIIRYTYMPLYDANIQYGYDPEKQVGNAIRDIAQSLFAREFNIIRV